jgi:hypothetical protein
MQCGSFFRNHFHHAEQSFMGYSDNLIDSEGILLKGWYAPISPVSPFAQCWELLSGILLLYSIFVTPFLIAFYTIDAGYCGPAPTG